MMVFLLKYRNPLIAFLLGGLLGNSLTALYWKERVSDIKAVYAKERQEASDAYVLELKEAQQKLSETQDKLLRLDTVKTEELTHARTENDRLRTLYSTADDDRKRLRISVKQARTTCGVSTDSSTGTVGDAASVELSDAAGSAVWNLRQALIDNEARLTYLQAYVCTIRPDPTLCP